MTTDTTVREAPQTSVQPQPAALEQLLDEVRRDSQQEALDYLEETKVPHGGE